MPWGEQLEAGPRGPHGDVEAGDSSPHEISTKSREPIHLVNSHPRVASQILSRLLHRWGDELRHRLMRIHTRMKHKLHQRHTLNAFRLDMFDAVHIVETGIRSCR